MKLVYLSPSFPDGVYTQKKIFYYRVYNQPLLRTM